MQTANPLDPLILLELLLPTGYALGLSYAILLFTAGLGLVMYLADRGVQSPPALALAGTAFALNPYFIFWLQDKPMLSGLAPVPMALFAMERILSHQRPRMYAALLALCVAFSALSGTLQLFVLLLLLLGVRLLWLLVTQRGQQLPEGRSRIAWVGGGAAAGMAIAFLPLAAGIELVHESSRLSRTEGYYAHNNFLHWRALGLWINPAIFGLPAQDEFSVQGSFRRMFMSGSGWGAMGVIPLGLATFALSRRTGPNRDRVFWWSLGGLTVAFLMLQGTVLHRGLISLAPWIQDVDLLRGLIVVNLAGAILSGWGAVKLEEDWGKEQGRSAWLKPWIAFLIVGLTVLLVATLGVRLPGRLALESLPFLILGISIIGLGVHARGRLAWPRRGLWILVALTALDLGRLHFTLNTFADPHLLYPPHPAITDLQHRLAATNHPRYLVEGQYRLFPPNTGSIYGLTDVRGYSNAPTRRFRMLLECAEHRQGLKNLPLLTEVDSPIYSLLGAEYLFSSEEVSRAHFDRVEGLWTQSFYRRKIVLPRAFLTHKILPVSDETEMRRVLADPSFDPSAAPLMQTSADMPRVETTRGPESVMIQEFNPTQVTIRASLSSPGMLVLSDVFYPGWRASVDGGRARIWAAYGGLRGVAVPEGDHEIVFTYRPHWLLPGSIVSISALVLVSLALV